MKKNMGATDRVLRILTAVVIVGLYFAHVITGGIAAILLVLAGIFIVTGLVSFCPLYLPFGIKTTATKE